MAQGKLVSFTPLMNGGVHDSYSGANGVLYKFTVNLNQSDGKTVIGTAMSSKQQPNWKLDEEYTYDVNVSGNNGQYTNIKGMKSINAGSFNGGGKKPNPAFSIQKCFEQASATAAAMMRQFPDNRSKTAYNILRKSFFNYCAVKDEQTRWIHIASLQQTIDYCDSMEGIDKLENEKVSDAYFRIANEYAATMKEQIATKLKELE